MARCGECTGPCQCEITPDGLLLLTDSEGDVFEQTQIGRQTSTVEGSGSATNPFVISFIDSTEYRPPAAHGVSTDIGDLAATDVDVVWTSKTYGTPSPISGFFVLPQFPDDLYLTDTFFQVVGASLVFTGGASGNVAQARIQVAEPPTFTRRNVGGHWGYADVAGTVILNMTATYMVYLIAANETSGINAIAHVIYTTTGTLQLQSAKYWMCQI